jgi:hypothetical protein
MNEEAAVHAVVVTVSIDPGQAQEAQAHLQSMVVPRVKETPGVVAGYWTRSSDGQHGSSLVVFETEEAAQAAADALPSTPRPEFIHFDSVDVREVVAQL